MGEASLSRIDARVARIEAAIVYVVARVGEGASVRAALEGLAVMLAEEADADADEPRADSNDGVC